MIIMLNKRHACLLSLVFFVGGILAGGLRPVLTVYPASSIIPYKEPSAGIIAHGSQEKVCVPHPHTGLLEIARLCLPSECQ